MSSTKTQNRMSFYQWDRGIDAEVIDGCTKWPIAGLNKPA